MRQMPPILSPVKERQELGLHHLQTPRENQNMSKEHATQSHLSNLEQEVQELKRQIQTLTWDLDASRNICSRKSERIRHLIRLGLETTRPEALDQWQEEEEL
jgi:molecular chaperone GrpE (heat shock protein)